MRPPSLNLEDPAARRRELLVLAEQVPGAWIGMKVAALLLLVEGQRPGWIAEVLGLTCMSLCRWGHLVNEQGYRMKRASHTYLQARSEDARRFQRTLENTAHS